MVVYNRQIVKEMISMKQFIYKNKLELIGFALGGMIFAAFALFVSKEQFHQHHSIIAIACSLPFAMIKAFGVDAK
jgi:poly(3-hydroxyalkanoate) synthetase